MLTNLKVAIIGDMGVGKTCFVHRVITDMYGNNNPSTIGASFHKCSVNTKNNKTFNLAIWDTAGQERFRSLISMYTRNTDVLIFVYDLSNKDSYYNVVDYWIPYVMKNRDSKLCLNCLVGTKMDLLGPNEIITEKESVNIENIYDGFFDDFFMVSSFSGYNINGLMDQIIESYCKLSSSAFGNDISYEDLITLNDIDVKKTCCGIF